MLWYGYVYYFLYFVLLFVFTTSFLRLNFISSSTRLLLVTQVSSMLLSSFLFLSLVSLIMLYYILDNFAAFFISYSSVPGEYLFFVYHHQTFLVSQVFLSLHPVSVYCFPFIYIFILITVLSVLFCLAYNTNELTTFMLYCAIILSAGYTMFFTNSLLVFFLSYEMLLIPSFFILYNFAKTRKCVEAAYLMFFWTQFGALFLIFGFLYLFIVSGSATFELLSSTYLSSFELNFIFFCLLFGFGVKLPVWPFYGWLPKAHVEASTNFSIFLSGVLVKFAFFGFLKCLISIQLEPTFYFVYPFLTIGIVDAVFKLFYQIDLKKLVAYSTVVEMHWLTICVISGQSALMLASFCMLISHALLSTNSFLLVDAIGRRFKTRLITEINGVNFLCPKLFLIALVNLLIFLGFPGSIMFVAEILFFSFFFDLYPALTLFYIVLLYLLAPTFFFRSWMNALFGSSSHLLRVVPVDLTSRELLVYGGLVVLMFWLGVSWQSLLV
jgi:NADH:ubiquinone oxidoreductase subunit 4 (subunit M)